MLEGLIQGLYRCKEANFGAVAVNTAARACNERDAVEVNCNVGRRSSEPGRIEHMFTLESPSVLWRLLGARGLPVPGISITSVDRSSQDYRRARCRGTGLLDRAIPLSYEKMKGVCRPSCRRGHGYVTIGTHLAMEGRTKRKRLPVKLWRGGR